MTLQECYEKLGGNYKDVASRLFNEMMVKKFVLKFLNDQSYSDLENAMQAEDYKQAFIAAHTIKGVSSNLSFTRLYNSSLQLTEALRSDTPDIEKAQSLFTEVSNDYKITLDAIRRYQAEA